MAARRHPKTLSLPFLDTIGRPDRDNCIDLYVSGYEDEVLADGVWQKYFKYKPEPLSQREKEEYLAGIRGVALGSDAFFPFSDNIDRAYKSGVSYVAEPGGSVRDDEVIAKCNEYGMTLSFTGMRLFHH